MSKSSSSPPAVNPLSLSAAAAAAAETCSPGSLQAHYFQIPRKLPKRKSRFKRSDGSTSSDTTSSFIKRQAVIIILSSRVQ
ncbi:hypothetical protein CRUP_012101 [Coryphaenoides rupestris]|nr:hypothetical protein CRUP_012101 [Coryphaenoides rupestris]